jgi:hypothetical protein
MRTLLVARGTCWQTMYIVTAVCSRVLCMCANQLELLYTLRLSLLLLFHAPVRPWKAGCVAINHPVCLRQCPPARCLHTFPST